MTTPHGLRSAEGSRVQSHYSGTQLDSSRGTQIERHHFEEMM